MECDAAGGSGVVRYVPLGASSAASEPPERRAAAAPTRDDGRGVRGVVGDIITSIAAGGDDDAPGWGGATTTTPTTDRGDGGGHQRGEEDAGGGAPLPGGATMNDGAGGGGGGGANVGRGPTCWKCRGLGTTTAKRNKRKPRKEHRGRCIHGEGAGQREGGDGAGGGSNRKSSSSESKSSSVDGVVHEGAAVPADDAGTHTVDDPPPRSPVSPAANHPAPVRLRCGVCDGRGRLPPKRGAEEASQRQPGVITRPRRITHPGFVPFGPTPRAIVRLRRLRLLSKRQRRPQLRRLAGEDGYEDGEEGGGSGGEVFDPDIVKDWNVRALELLERAETHRTEVEVPVPPADEPSGQPHYSNAPTLPLDPTPPPPRPAPARRPSWLPGPGEQLCNLVGQFRILQRVGSHRWTTDDLVTAHVASTEARRNFHSWRRAEEEEKDNGSDDDGGGGGPGAGDGCYRYLDLGCGNASVLLMTAWSLVQILGDGGGGGGGGRGAAAPDDGKDGEDSSAGAPVGVGVDDGRLEHVERMEMEMEKTGDREKNEEAVVRERRRRRMLCCTGVEARGEASRLARRSIEFNLGCIPSSSSTTPPSPPPPRSSSASPPPTSTFYEVPAPHGEGAGDTGTGGGGGGVDEDGGSRVAVDVRAEVVHGDFRHLISNGGRCGGGGEDDDRGRHSHGEDGGVVNAPAPPPHTDAHADMGSNEGEGESGNFGGGGRGRTMTTEVEWEYRDEDKRGGDKFHLITGTPPYFRVDFAVSSTTAANERDGGATTTTAEPHSSSSSGGRGRVVVHNAVIRQGGMPTSLQSAPARCEFRGGIEEYCMAASCCLHPHLGVFVVCENWANRGRVHGGAALAGLVVVRVLPVRGKVGRPHPLFAVYVMRKREYFSTQRGGGDDEGHVGNEEASIPEQPEVLPCLSVRDEGGRWTEEYGRVLDSLSIPAEAAVSGQF